MRIPEFVQNLIICKISGERTRLAGETVPESVFKSDNNPNDGGSPHNVIDLNFLTSSKTSADQYGKTWFRFQLDQIHCVKHVLSFKDDGTVRRWWICTATGCSICDGERCSIFALMVYIENTEEYFSPPAFPDCKYGDTVKVERNALDGSRFTGYEFAIFVKGEARDGVFDFCYYC